MLARKRTTSLCLKQIIWCSLGVMEGGIRSLEDFFQCYHAMSEKEVLCHLVY